MDNGVFSLILMDLKDLKVFKDLKVVRVNRDHLDLKDLKVRKVLPVQMEQPVLNSILVRMNQITVSVWTVIIMFKLL